MWTKEQIPDQSGKTVIVTGTNTGIGYETALALYEAGARVILACRDLKKADDTRARIQAQPGSGMLETGVLNLADLTSVSRFTDLFGQAHNQLHVLINNAGVATPPASKTAQGYELQFGVNFLGHFALTGRLYSLLDATPESRVVTLSSMGYQSAIIDFDNLRSEKSYDPLREYRQSKLANLLFAVELQRRIIESNDQVRSIAAQPGANKTELTRHLSDEDIAVGIERIGGFMDPSQGALSVLYAAVSPDVSGGAMYEPDQGGYRGYPSLATLQQKALDEPLAEKLWAFAEHATGIHFPG